MSSFTEYVPDPDVVLLDLVADTPTDVGQRLHGELVLHASGVTDASRFLVDLQERMALAPVTIADQIALPHARTEAVSRLVMAVARLKEGVAFDVGHPRVRLVFLIGTPRNAVTEYLRLVAALTRLLRRPAARSGLMTASDETDFRAMLASSVAATR